MATKTTELLTIILHAIRVKGFADADHVVDATGLAARVVSASLHQAAADELAVFMDGRIRGWRLTPTGQVCHRARIDAQLDRADARPIVEAAYDQFLTRNEPFKELCTRWQLEGQPPSCIDELSDVHEFLGRVVDGLSKRLDRFVPYRRRSDATLDRLRAGEVDAFTKPLARSYHDLWMELHQDLLLTLDRQRSITDGA